MNDDPTKELISYLKGERERQQWQNERFLSLMERMLSRQNLIAAQTKVGWNFQQDCFSYSMSNQMLHDDHTNHNSHENFWIYSIFRIKSGHSISENMQTEISAVIINPLLLQGDPPLILAGFLVSPVKILCEVFLGFWIYKQYTVYLIITFYFPQGLQNTGIINYCIVHKLWKNLLFMV